MGSSSRVGRCSRVVACGLVLAAGAGLASLWVVAPVAIAQPGMGGGRGGGGGGGGGFGSIMREWGAGQRGPELSRRDVDLAMDDLALSDDQRDATLTLFDGYQERLAAMQDEQRAAREDAMRTMRETGDTSALTGLRDAATQMRTKRQELQDQFFADMRGLLNAPQGEQWAQVQQRVVRHQRLRRGMLPGERLDVGMLVRETTLTPEQRATLADVLSQYEVDIDRQLAAREAADAQPLPDFRQAMQTGDWEDMRKAMTQRRDAALKVREANKRFARQVELLLPEEQRAAFTQQVRQATYPEVYRDTHARTALDAASKMADLTDEQAARVFELKDRYNVRLAQLQPRMEKATDELETVMDPQTMTPETFRQLGDSEWARVQRERRELDREIVSALKSSLSPEQAKLLPEEPREDRGWGPGARPGRVGARPPV